MIGRAGVYRGYYECKVSYYDTVVTLMLSEAISTFMSQSTDRVLKSLFKGGQEGRGHMLLLLLPLPIFHHSRHHDEQPQYSSSSVGTSLITSTVTCSRPEAVCTIVGGAICWKSSVASGKGTEKTRHTTLPLSLPLLQILTLGGC